MITVVRRLILGLILAHCVSSGLNAQVVWDGGAGTSLWTDANNWNPNGVPATTADLQFNGASSLSVNLNGNQTANSISLSGTNAYTFSNNTLTLSSGNLTVASPTSGSVTDIVSSGITFSTNATENVGSNATLLLSGSNTGAGTLTKAGAGTVILSGANTFTGNTTISAGTLQLGNGGTTGSLSGSITNNANLSFNYSTLTDVANAISGSGTVTQNSSATVRLTGTNTFAGALTISSGNIAIGNGGSTGSITANVVDNGNLIFNRTTDYSYAGNISGSGSIYKESANTLTLTGTSTYTGVTNLEGGTVNFTQTSNLGNGGEIRLSGGTLQWASGNTTDISSRTVFVDSGGATFDTNSNNITFANAIGNAGTGSVTFAGGGTVTLLGNDTYTGQTIVNAGSVLQIGNGGTSGSIANSSGIDAEGLVSFERSDNVTYAGAITGDDYVFQKGSGTLTLTNSSTHFTGLMDACGGGTLVIKGTPYIEDLDAGDYYYGGDGTATIDGVGTKVSVDYVTLGNDYTGILNLTNGAELDAGTVYAGITNYGSSAITISGGGKLVTGDFGNSLPVTIDNGTISATSSQTWGGTFTINSGGFTADVASGQAVTVSNGISGTGALTKTSAGALILTGTNTYSGGTVISSGTLQVGSSSALGSLTGSITNNSALIFGSSQTYAGSISGAGTVEILGTNNQNVALTGSSTGTGTITIDLLGGLYVGNGGTSGSISADVVAHGLLAFNRSDNVTYAGAITGDGDGAQRGSGTLTLTNSSTHFTGTMDAGGGGTLVIKGTPYIESLYAGDYEYGVAGTATIDGVGTKVSVDVVTLGDDYTGILNITNGAELDAGTVYAGITNYGSSAINISGGGKLVTGDFGNSLPVTIDNGTISATSSQTWGGTFTINSGGLTADVAAGNTVTVTAPISNSGTINFATSANQTLSGVISGSGDMIKSGTGTLTLIGANSFTGNTTISAGTLQLGNGGTTGSLSGSIIDNANLSFNYSTLTDVSNAISGSGTVTQNSSATVRLTGANTFTGDLTIASGNIAIGNGGTTGSITANVVDNGNLIFNRTTDYTYAGNISGFGSIYKVSTNTLTLTGTNTYSGNTTVNAGTLKISGSLGSGSYAGNISNSGALVFSSSSDQTLSGVISGTGNVTFSGEGAVTLLGNNTYTGTTTLSGAVLYIGSGGTSGSIAGDLVFSSGGVYFSRSDDVVYAGTITGSGNLDKDGAGSLTLTGSGQSSLDVSVNSGTLIVDGGATPRFSSFTAGNSSTGSIVISGAGTRVTTAYAVTGQSGTGTLTVTNNASLILTGDGLTNGIVNYGSSSTTISSGGSLTTTSLGGGAPVYFDSGTIAFTADDTSSNPVTLNSGGGTIGTNANSVGLSGPISGSGSLTKTGSGILALTGSNTYSGGTTISAGTLKVNNTAGSGTGTGAVNVVNGATLGGGNGSEYSGSLVSQGNATLKNYAASTVGTISGSLTIESGAHLAPGNSVGTLTTASLTLNLGSILDYEFNSTSNDFTFVSSSGGLTLNGGGFNLYQEGTTNAFSSPGSYNLLGYSGTLNGSVLNLSVLNPTSGYSYTFANDSADGLVQLDIAAIPEPSTWVLLTFGLLFLVGVRQRYRFLCSR